MLATVTNEKSLKMLTRARPHTIRVDQGCQFTSKELDLWAHSNDITMEFSGKANR